jgi:predicted phosphodiesterase
MKLTILHLSDLHIKSDSTPQELVLSSLIRKLQEITRAEPIKVLIVTGDIAFSGKSVEYEKAKELLNKIIHTCKIDIRNIFMIPGNHDVDRSKIKPGYINWWYNFQDEGSLQLVLDSDDALPKIEAAKEAYFAFTQELMNKNIVLGKFGQYVHDVFIDSTTSLIKVKIVGLNSALFSGYDGDDKSKLALGLEQVAYCEEKVNLEREIVITCIHHPFNCFHYCESPTINVIKRMSDVILSGHLHEERNAFQREGNTGEVITISAGAAYEKRLHNNSFNIIQLDLISAKGKVVFYKYLPDQHEWILNKEINHKNEGVFEFSFSKKIVEDSISETEQKSNLDENIFTYKIELTTDFQGLTRDKLNSIVDLLKICTGDNRLQLINVQPGSTIITFQCSVEMYDKLKEILSEKLQNELQKFELFQDIGRRETVFQKSILHWKTRINNDYFHLLNSVGANFIHPRVENLKLSNLFVPPNMRRIKTDLENGIEKVVNATDLINKIPNSDLKIIFYGSESSGKSTLLKSSYITLYEHGYIPILLTGEKIKEVSERKLKQFVLEELQKQYQFYEDLTIDDFDSDRLILLVDDFHRIRFTKSKYKANLLISLQKVFRNIIISASEFLQYETYTTKSGNTRSIFEGFDQLSILEFGPKARYELIRKWNGLGNMDKAPNDLIRFNNETESYVETLIGKNFVPSYPIYLITILQAKDLAISQNPEYSLHGFYYELLINESLNKAVKNKDEISLFYNYITDYCYFLFYENIRDAPVSIEDLYKFHDNYCLEYNITVNLNVVLNTLINSKLLRLTHDDKFVSIPYKYIYYYFTAKYLANNIATSEIKNTIKSLCERIHRDEFSSIVMFLTHLSKDQFIIHQLLENSKTLFVEFKPATLDQDVVFINEMVTKLPQQVYVPKDVDKAKEEELKENDELEAQGKEFKSEADVYDYDLSEDITALDAISKITKAMKTIEITGQVTKKYWGSLKAPQKLELAEETYMLGLRTLSFYFSLIKTDTDHLIAYLNYIFKQKNSDKSYTREQIDKASRNYLFGLCVRASVGIIKGISNSIGYDKLSGTFEELNILHDINSVNLIDSSIKLDYNKDFPWKEIDKLNKNTKDHYLGKAVLRSLVINYLYLFHTSIKEKQKICSKLGIQIDKQLLIDATSMVKKDR